MSLIKTWAPYFQSGVRIKGRHYQMAGRVHRLPAEEGEMAHAKVQGKREYEVVIRGEGASASAHCTCPFFQGGAYCKHIWATLLDLHHNPAPASEAAPQIRDASPRLPKARKRSSDEAPSRRTVQAEPEWVGRLSLLRPATLNVEGAAPAASPLPYQVCYLVSPELSLRHNALVVELRQRQPTRSGWSKLKRFKISAPALMELPDAVDRELCAILLGSRPAGEYDGEGYYESDRARSAFRIQPGAWRAMLQRMVRTGRCFVERDGGESVPLNWDVAAPAAGADAVSAELPSGEADTWILWMIGALNDAGDMEVTVELRRGSQEMAIDVPRLVLGGPDGVVVYGARSAPFDDCGAFRWVSQFRDDVRFRGERAPIIVPAGDVVRFLDRLYAMPQLPEIDLPEGVGRAELAVSVVPHLEVFTPDAATRGREQRPLRGQLSARCWFAYGEHRVRPGQPGRFLAATEADAAAAESAVPGGGSEGDGLSAGAPAAEVPADAGQQPATAENDREAVTADTPEGDPQPEQDGPSLQHGLIRRDLIAERRAVTLLLSLGLRPSAVSGETFTLAAGQLPLAVATLLRAGWVIAADQRIVRHPGTPRLNVTSGIDWFELRGSMRFQTDQGEQEVPLPAILAAARAGEHMIRLGDGSHGLLPEAWLRDHGLLAAIGQVEDDHIRFKASQAALLDALLRTQDLVEVDQRFAEARTRLRQFEGVQPRDAAPSFHGTLRPYQREGLGWLHFLNWFGMGGILADDMGLGKTIQLLAWLDDQYARQRQPHADNGNGQAAAEHRPSLIVVPRSVVFNWMDEAQRFAPELRVQAYTGADREALREAFDQHDVIITSYGLLRRDIMELRKCPFEYVVLDEAQAIKNPGSQSAKAARLLDSRHRLALTGTPVENHPGDLWSIFEFLNPGMLGSSTRFGELLRNTGTEARDLRLADANDETDTEVEVQEQERIERASKHEADLAIARALRPFILRRTKRQVLKDLPEKIEQTIVCEMEPDQRRIYDDLRQHYRAALLRQFDAVRTTGHAGDTGMGGSSMMVLEALLRLRQAACHPGLIDPKRAEEPSAKLEALLDSLTELIDEGHKALVFSQFTSMLALVRARLDQMGVPYEYLDGQTRNRKQRVQRFQGDPSVPVFLISLKAGGLGLNLTAADYVFILDPWWNPAVEAQAIDRAHRIGQTRNVIAYRLICKDTVEQRIAELQQKKRDLADAIIGGEQNLLRNLTRDDLEALLS